MKKQATMTISDWRLKCEELYDGLESGKVKVVDAVERNNTIGKVASLFKLELMERMLEKGAGSRIKQLC